MKTSGKTFPTDWKDKIEKGGKFFEQKIATLVNNSGFGWVVPNYAFVDIEAGISRELDVFAISGHRIGRKWNFIFPILLISVSNKPIVCFTRKEYMSPYTTAWIQFSGFPKTIYSKGEELELFEFLKLEKTHHYYKVESVSSQFWTPLEKSETQGEYFYKDLLLPLIKSVVAEKDDHEKGWEYDPEGEPINLQFYYPIIVVNDLWECSFTENKSPYYRAVDSIVFLFHTASKGYAGDYFIDICTEQGLKNILKTIDNEISRLAKDILKHRKILEKSALKDAEKRGSHGK